MKNFSFIFSPLAVMLALSLASIVLLGQEKTVTRGISGEGLSIKTYKEIPEANEPCVPSV